MYKKLFTQYVAPGVSLSTRSLDIYLFIVILSFIESLLSLITNTGIKDAAAIITLPFIFGYYLSLPRLFIAKQHGKNVGISYIWPIVLVNTRRMILPAAGLFIILMVLLFLFVIAGFFYYEYIGYYDMNSAAELMGKQALYFLFLIYYVASSLFVFAPIYFSIENQKLFAALSSSVQLSLQHIHFVCIIICFNLLSFGIMRIASIVTTQNFLFGKIISTLAGEYVILLIAATALYYYQHHRSSNTSIKEDRI